MNTRNCALVGIACATGIVGDSLLRLGGPTGWGLNEYFKQHGRAESIFIRGNDGYFLFNTDLHLHSVATPANNVYSSGDIWRIARPIV